MGDKMQLNYKELYLDLIRKNFKTKEDVGREIINLKAILSLPKGTEHFMSDIHGEYEAFRHILNNCSGVIKEKVDIVFEKMDEFSKKEFCTLIYYPSEKIQILKQKGLIDDKWYKKTIKNLIDLTSYISSKYTRSKVKKAIDPNFSYIIDELLHTKANQETNVQEYFSNIINTIVEIGCPDGFIIEFARLIKVLAVDHLHVAGDIFDRGANPDKIIDLLMEHHSLDIEWGNHDVLWFGAAAGIPVCIFQVLYNNLKYDNLEIFENSYGISLRKIINYANALYHKENNIINPIIKTILIILLKLEGQIIDRNPEFNLNERKVLSLIDLKEGMYQYGGESHILIDKCLKNINPNNPYEISAVEEEIIKELVENFKNSVRLQQHINFLIDNGSVYKVFNDNLIYHGCIPLKENGDFQEVRILGESLKSKAYLDKIDYLVRKVCKGAATTEELDYMYYLWSGFNSPFTGRIYKTFELKFLTNKELQKEPRNPYYNHRNNPQICDMILSDFGVSTSKGHIINGHLPVKTIKGEKPILADGKLIIIDGGFCKAYHEKTGIAGYTLIANSHGMRIKAHGDFTSIDDVITNNSDIMSESKIIETSKSRIHVKDTDNGKIIENKVESLVQLLKLYREEENNFTK